MQTGYGAAQERPPSRFRFSTGLEFSRGDHGAATNSDIVYIPNQIAYDMRPWTLGITIPYVLITGRRTVVTSFGTPVTTGAAPGPFDTQRGLGDLVLSAIYNQSRTNDRFVLEYIAKVKLPTADHSPGVGTGEFDFSGQVDASFTAGVLKPFASLGYRVLGDPDGMELNDGYFASLGAELAASRRYEIGLSFDYREATIDYIDDAMELVPYLGWNATQRLKANFYLVVGLTEGSTDYGGGFRITVR